MSESELIHKRLSELQDLYVEVKEAIILAENFDKDHELYIAPVNELRNALDHIMRSISQPDKIDHEFNEAQEHLFRAGYDAYEVFAVNVAGKIVKIIEKYDREIITDVFPSYYTEVRKNLIEIQVGLASIRSKRNTGSPIGITSMTPYKNKISELVHHLQICEHNIPALEIERKKKKKNFFISNAVIITITALITLAVTVAGLYIYDRYFHNEAVESSVNKIHTQLSKSK